MEDDKLYTRVVCSICCGSRKNRNGGGCYYCDIDAMTFIECSFVTLQEKLQKLSAGDKAKLVRCLNEDVI